MEGQVRAAVGVAAGGTMTPDLEIWRAANELIEQHGDDAPVPPAQGAPGASVCNACVHVLGKGGEGGP